MRTNTSFSAAGWWLVSATLLCSCAPQTESPDETSMNQASSTGDAIVSAGELMDQQISYEFAIYYTPAPTKDPLVELDGLLKSEFADFERVEKISKEATRPSVSAQMRTDVAKSYPPPTKDSLQYFGRGLNREQAEALQKSNAVLVLEFAYSKKHVWDGMRAALKLTDALARRTGGLIWDNETRQVFTPDTWQDSRINDWKEDIPDLSKHTTIHAYKKDDYVRAITLGMAKFGLPDIVIDKFSWSLNTQIGHIVNMFSQAIAEGMTPQRAGEFDLNIKAIKNSKVREPQLAALKPNATAIAPLALRKGTWEEGDPANRLIEITFDRCPGPDVHAKQEHMVSSLFGWTDAVTRVNHDAELEAASRRARTKLRALREEFGKGLAPGEFIQVKAPFETPDASVEWMWVEIISWKGDKITGLLSNEPHEIPNLHAGQIVEVSEAKVFDFIRKHADGTSEGNETGKLIEKHRETPRAE